MTRGGADTSTPPEPGAPLSGTRPQPWTLSPTPQPAHHPWALVTEFFARASRAFHPPPPSRLRRGPPPSGGLLLPFFSLGRRALGPPPTRGRWGDGSWSSLRRCSWV